MSNEYKKVEDKEKDQFNQLCVMEGTLFPEGGVDEFHKFFEEQLDVRVKFENQVKTLPDMEDGEPVPETGDRNDLFFYVHDDDIGKFSVQRLSFGIKWWEDVLLNGNGKLYDEDVLKAYPATWE